MVGDRYVHRERSAEIVAVTATHVVIEVTRPDECFRKSVTREEFPILEKRTLGYGAVFKPAPNTDLSSRSERSAPRTGSAVPPKL